MKVIIYPIENFFSALDMVFRSVFSALAVMVAACIRVMPYGFGIGDGGLAGLETGGGEEDGEGAALASFGEEGRLGHRVRENVDPDEFDAESDKEEELECLLSDLVIEEDALLKSDLAGEVVKECPGDSARFGEWACGEGG